MNIKTEELDTGIKLTATIPMFEEKELEIFDNNIHNIAKEYCEMHLKEKDQILTQRLIKILEEENIKYKEEIKEADEAVEYWQKECDKRSKVLDKIREEIKKYKYTDSWGDTVVLAKYIEDILEEIE